MDLKQYEINAPNEYMEDIIKELGEVMNIPIDFQELNGVFERVIENQWFSEIFIAKDPKDPRCFILVELKSNDYIYGFVIRCNKTNFIKAKETLLKWEQFCKKEYYQPNIPNDLDDVFMREDTLLKRIVQTYGIDL
ncbi:hypothetical protein [Brevibacillus dissolubilis]|uniref:hypothetical protein n=1 Tax=Brevibacillus dissolubilis TaxID=1844116 RepID=UPI001116D3A3|nr:hypothetical protein [Brevibacillus dissolubilis]